MIRNSQVKLEIAQDWEVVQKLCDPTHRTYQVAGGVGIQETRPEDSYNLPFVLAYAVLDQVLSELRDQGTFPCASWQLGAKMAASRNILPWQDYDSVHAGKEARNDLAHKAKLLSRSQCIRYIQAVEVELRAWAVM